MPQAIAALITSSLVAGTTAFTIVSALLTLAITIGIQSLVTGGVGKPSDGQRVVRATVGTRVRHYGKVRVGGQLTFYESRDGTLYVLVTLGTGRINAISEYLLNGRVVTVNGSGLVTDSKFNGAVSIFNRLGTDTQTAYSELTSVFSEWTSNHRQRGCPSILMTCDSVEPEEFSEVYEGGREPEPIVTLEGSLVYDPRLDSTFELSDGTFGSGSHRIGDESTWAYSTNWALCFADFLANADGFGLGYDAVNWQNIAGEADISDESFTTQDARTVARWQVGGSYSLAEDERRAVVKEFLKAGDGFMWQDASGLVNVRAGRWIEPTVEIPEKHIIACSASLGTDPLDAADELRVVYTDPNQGYVETEAASPSATNTPNTTRVDAFFIPEHNQAQRVRKRLAAQLEADRWQLTMTTNIYGLNVIGERFVTVTISELGISSLAFEVTGFEFDLGTSERGPQCSITLKQAKESDWTFDSSTEEGTAPNSPPDTVATITVEAPANVIASAVQLSLENANGVGIELTWDASTRTGLIAQAQFKENADSIWQEMTVSREDRKARSGIVNSGVLHDVRVRFLTITGRPSAWTSTTITPTANELAPSTPADFTASGGTGDATLNWRNPFEAGFEKVIVYSNSVDNFGTATATGDEFMGALGQEMMETITLSAGSYFLWLTAESTGGAESAETASQSVTVS